jgi:hypothetical protein
MERRMMGEKWTPLDAHSTPLIQLMPKPFQSCRSF